MKQIYKTINTNQAGVYVFDALVYVLETVVVTFVGGLFGLLADSTSDVANRTLLETIP